MIKTKFQIIPAVDLLDGQVVRLYQGDYDQSKVYGDNPSEPIKEFLGAGAELIHIVDLNAARTGERDVNARAIEEIVGTTQGQALLELGGGIRNMEALEHYLNLGIARGIVGTSAVKDPEFLKAALKKHGGERVIVGVDARDGEVKIAGWEQGSGKKTDEYLPELEAKGVVEVIYTDIATDGAMTGPAIGAIKQALAVTEKLRIVASGGISSLEDVHALLELKEPRISGAISGRAIYEKKLDLRAAVELCRA